MNTEHKITTTIIEYSDATGASFASAVGDLGAMTGVHYIECSIRLQDLGDGNLEATLLDADLSPRAVDIIRTDDLYAWLVGHS